MLKSRYIDGICIEVITAAVLLTVLFMNGRSLGIVPASSKPGYESRLFDKSRVHLIDIVIDDWEAFLETASDEVYTACTLVIDGEAYSNVGIRTKGNNSKNLVAKYGLSRYSLKIEFDHFINSSYYGLDKFSLDCSFQDNSYLKTWIALDMMDFI